MATNVTADALLKPGMTFCKKCSLEHEKPVGNKCERSKQVAKETEKRDSSRESLPVKKTPKGKVGESQDKMLDLVLNTMTNVTEKLSAIDDRIIGLASCIDATPAKASTRKSRPREQSKRRGVIDAEEALFASPTGAPLIQEGGTSCICDVFVPATERNVVSNPVNPPTLDKLHSNPLIQQLVEERMAALEAKMKLEI